MPIRLRPPHEECKSFREGTLPSSRSRHGVDLESCGLAEAGPACSIPLTEWSPSSARNMSVRRDAALSFNIPGVVASYLHNPPVALTGQIGVLVGP